MKNTTPLRRSLIATHEGFVSAKHAGFRLVFILLMSLVGWSTEIAAQDIHFYNGTECEISVRITYGQSGCPASTPTTTVCTNLNTNGATGINAPSGFPRISQIEVFCGYDCITANYQVTWLCSHGTTPQSFTCCDYDMWIQGYLDINEFRIDQQ
jgi:hypothetical protein